MTVMMIMAPVIKAPMRTSQPAKPRFASDLTPGIRVESMPLFVAFLSIA
jgi:hypothetical protein